MKYLGRSVVLLFGACVVAACSTASQSSPAVSSGASSDGDVVVARVGDQPITLDAVDEKVLTTNLQVFQDLYDARRQAIEEIVAEAVLAQEAASRGITSEELVAEEITSKVPPVTEEDIQAFFDQNRARLGGQTLEQIGPQIREYLVARNESGARERFIGELREAAGVDVALEPPRVPITVASNERMKGPEDATITIVEYSDFQ